MKNALAFLALIAAFLCSATVTPAAAQIAGTCNSNSGPFGMIVGGPSAGSCTYLTVNADGSINTNSSGGGSPTAPYAPTAIVGTQRGVSIASATALTIPATATFALISLNGSNNSSGVCAYWQDDSTNPTGSAGNPLAAGASLPYNAVGLPIKLIQATGATCTFNAAYYK